MKTKIREILDTLLVIALILFGWFIIYQILRKVFGGSWVSESLIIGLLILNITLTFNLTKETAEIKTDLYHLRTQFQSLAQDFKEHLKRTNKR